MFTITPARSASSNDVSDRSFRIHLAPGIRFLLIAALVLPWLLIGWMAMLLSKNKPAPQQTVASPASQPISQSVRAVSQTSNVGYVQPPSPTQDIVVHEGNPGPWGRIEIVPTSIETPEEYLVVPDEKSPPVQWTFKEMTRNQSLEFLRQSGVSETQLALLVEDRWKATPAGAVVEPGDEFILSLSTEARKTIYGRLAQWSENLKFVDPYWFRQGRVEFRLAGAELSPDTFAMLKRLLYPFDKEILLFADIEPAVRQIKDKRERVRFMQAVSRKRTLFARIMIDKDSDIESIASYWAPDGRQKDLIPLLSSLRTTAIRGVEKEAKLNVICLLPQFVRERLYTHSYASSTPGAVKQDCFWSALNFFCDEPDNKFNDMQYTGQVLSRDYYAIREPARMGDLILLTDKDSNAMHAAAYIADNIVFSKNGEAASQPWLLVRMEDMLATYRIHTPDLKVLAFRKKNL